MNALSQTLLWQTARGYAGLYGWVKDHFGRNLRGLGYLLRRVRSDHVIEANGLQWYFDHRIAAAYARLIAGDFNEPETHAFLQFIAGALPAPFTFVDVGANIGEMVISMAVHPNVRRSIGFEPHEICAAVCRKHIELNRLERAEIRRALMGNGALSRYMQDEFDATNSGVRPDDDRGREMRAERLDEQLNDVAGETVILIDAEGSELEIMRGGINFIGQRRPLLIFEYNVLTRRFFSLDDVRALLGEQYELFRLRGDGYVDRELNDPWNCVAVHHASVFGPLILETRLKHADG